MALYKDPKQAIIDAMSAQNNLTLVASQYTFGVPQVLDPAEGDLNSTIEVTAIYPTSPYDGAVTVKYHRLPLSDLNVLIPLIIKVNGITKISDLLPVLNAAHGFNFTTDDINEGDIALTNGYGTATLVAKAGSLGWIGSVDLQIAPGDILIQNYVTNRSLPGLIYPAPDNTKPFGYFYSYWRDFSNHYEDLTLVVTGTDDLAELATILTDVTGDAWSSTASGRYSLQGAAVYYNGPTSGAPSSNQDYQNVCIVTLGSGSIGLTGQLYIHYSQPF